MGGHLPQHITTLIRHDEISVVRSELHSCTTLGNYPALPPQKLQVKNSPQGLHMMFNMISLITFTVYLLAAILQSEVFHMVICLSVVPANNFSPSGLKLAILISCESCPVRGPDSNNWWHFTTLLSPEGLHWHYTENPGGAILRTQKNKPDGACCHQKTPAASHSNTIITTAGCCPH